MSLLQNLQDLQGILLKVVNDLKKYKNQIKRLQDERNKLTERLKYVFIITNEYPLGNNEIFVNIYTYIIIIKIHSFYEQQKQEPPRLHSPSSQQQQLQPPSSQQQQSQTLDIMMNGKKGNEQGIKSNGLMDMKANYDNNGGNGMNGINEMNGMNGMIVMDIDQEHCNKRGGTKEKESNDKKKGKAIRKDGTNNHHTSFGNGRKEKTNLNKNYQPLDHRGKRKRKNAANNHYGSFGNKEKEKKRHSPREQIQRRKQQIPDLVPYGQY